MTTQQTPANENTAQKEAVATPELSPLEAQAQEITQLKEEVARLKDQWVRAAAETENVRKRSQKEKEETSRYAINAFAADMVSVLENLKRASESVPPAQREQHELLNIIGQGVDMTLQELLGIFQRYNITRLDPKDQKFDHNFHQAVAQVERDDIPAGTVVQVVQAGYLIYDRLLQPAMVVVSKAPEAAKKVDTTA